MSETIEIKKDTFLKGTIAILAILLIISIFTGGFGFGGNANGNVILDPDEGGNNLPPINMKALIDDDAMKGEPDAPVTIVEFSDYECSFCARFYSSTLSQIQSEYIDTGKVKFVYRDFPLPMHQNAQKAAEAAECAGEQGKYYNMHNILFEQGVQGGVSGFKAYAQQIGLDTTEFNSCLDSGQMASEIQKDLMDGQKAGIKGTPGFIINGKLISGAQPFSVFQQEIEAALAA